MPFYTYECEICDNQHTEVRPVAERRIPATCTECGAQAPIKITATQIAPVHGAGSGTGHSKVTQTPPK